MRPEGESPDEHGRGLLTGVLLMVLAGAALGIGFNTMLLAAGPTKGLPWVRIERSLASLEDLVAVRDSGGVAAADTLEPAHPADASARPSEPGTTPVPATAPGGHPAGTETKRAPATPVTTPTPPSTSEPAPATAASEPAAPPASRAIAPVIPDMREPLEARYETVRALWDANGAVFVDARTAAEFAAERIERAVSLPLDDLGKNPDLVKNFSSGGRPVVVYCGGGECELSKNLAWNLVDAGHRKVLVYLGGIAEWKQKGAPLTGGGAGGSR